VTNVPDEDNPDDMLEDLFGPIISSYTTEQAVEDGVLIHTGNVGPHQVYFTHSLWEEGYSDLARRIELVNRGLDLLRQRDPEDSPYMKLRVIEQDKIWVIAERGKLTYLKPEDY